MNGGEGTEEMEEDGREMGKEKDEEDKGMEKIVLMWGYLPGVSPQRSPLLQPVAVRPPGSTGGDAWRDVCGGGCGFAMAISEAGKLITWGSTDDMGQSYLTSGKHEEIPEPFPLPTEVEVVKAAAGWAHCVAVTACGEVYTWGWKECVPTGKLIGEQHSLGSLAKEERQSGFLNEQVSPRFHCSKSSSGTISNYDGKASEETTKRRRTSSSKHVPESSFSREDSLSALPCLVTLGAVMKITTVAAGGRHTLALSDAGQVWGWGYGGEGQLGLGSRIRMVSSPHPVPCIESACHAKDRSSCSSKAITHPEGLGDRVVGCCVKAIACGGRHSAVVTDSGAVLTFGWGLYGQCGHGDTDDELSPKCVSSLLGIKMQGIAAGLWHTLCVSADGDVYAFGGNQFGQLGTGSDQAETLPKLLDAPSLESKDARIVSCGARHSSILTEDGEVFCWGWNKYGQLSKDHLDSYLGANKSIWLTAKYSHILPLQLGLGDSVDRSIPSRVTVENLRMKNVSCGWWHTLVLAEPRA
ncbi:Ultraviolet-B receptor UVR8 [Apostasia shenzhenica]|uniref:Ultraviolet-B receptor UVR8 n=1 Tax=Apostasia shenzhenica TaxID=1088818 RepID=A0A2I0B861_9ASPA|nr:Ultraviolet-B receptor UVR8 [Apostasia shenzhenica]